MTKQLAATLALLALSTSALAQSYPTRPITWIVPFAAGGPTDALARNIADRVGRDLGQPVLIENQAGAGGTIGAGKAAKATPDGYTFLVGHMGYMAAAPSLYKKLSYDPVKDFEGVFRFPDTPLVLLVGANSKFKTVQDLVAFASANPGKLNFGNAGVGSTSHLVAAMFAQQARIKVTPVSYKGAGPALTDVMGGQVDGMFDQTNTALPQVKGGKVVAVAQTAKLRVPQFPGVPTVAETVVPNFEASTWYGLYAPKGTPKDVIARNYAAFAKAIADPEFAKKLADQGIQLLPDAAYKPAALNQHTAAEVAKWKAVITAADIKLD
ncbi:Bug family tripartite tricarboxylate transporter substrate binding protein [Cupriavidus basilensis]|uniref:Bug family tripartite tricarboxylate transporter substrate binding protein n=1 Tax=Cupriavidus basilensis TaxID=68895 RepID=UPI0020A6339A|nr:tripartite tricarboxylate transporter substrate-binding protein [Cupriavidus basilensis]MCP3020078.1 tripartite tricarboxylate transporter substrate-binding protein [Cupriavidus basilensis]